MDEQTKFTYSYEAPTETERREIEDIKKDYEPRTKEENKLEKLRALDKKVKLPPLIAAIVLGVVGTLIFGTGLTMALEWNLILWGTVVMVPGFILAAIAYPVKKHILKRNKQKYGEEILKLSEELLHEN